MFYLLLYLFFLTNIKFICLIPLLLVLGHNCGPLLLFYQINDSYLVYRISCGSWCSQIRNSYQSMQKSYSYQKLRSKSKQYTIVQQQQVVQKAKYFGPQMACSLLWSLWFSLFFTILSARVDIQCLHRLGQQLFLPLHLPSRTLPNLP